MAFLVSYFRAASLCRSAYAGLVVQVPPFIGTGERIKVNTDDGAYIERA